MVVSGGSSRGVSGLSCLVKLFPNDLDEPFYGPGAGINTSFCVSSQECYVLAGDGEKIYYFRVINCSVQGAFELMDGRDFAVYYSNGIIHYARTSPDGKMVYYGRLRIVNGSLVKEYEEVVDTIKGDVIGGSIIFPNIAVSDNGEKLIAYNYQTMDSQRVQNAELRVNGRSIYSLKRDDYISVTVPHPVFIDNTGYVVFSDLDGYVRVYKIEGSQETFIGRSIKVSASDDVTVVGFKQSLYITYVSDKDTNLQTINLMVVRPDGSIIEKEIFDFQLDPFGEGNYQGVSIFVYTKIPALYVLLYLPRNTTQEIMLYLLRINTEDYTARLEFQISEPIDPYYTAVDYNFSTLPVVSSGLQLFTFTVYRVQNYYAYYNIMLGMFLLPIDHEAKPTNLLPLLLMLLLLIMFLRAGLKRFKEG
jgi:hypothetical protein